MFLAAAGVGTNRSCGILTRWSFQIFKDRLFTLPKMWENPKLYRERKPSMKMNPDVNVVTLSGVVKFGQHKGYYQGQGL